MSTTTTTTKRRKSRPHGRSDSVSGLKNGDSRTNVRRKSGIARRKSGVAKRRPTSDGASVLQGERMAMAATGLTPRETPKSRLSRIPQQRNGMRKKSVGRPKVGSRVKRGPLRRHSTVNNFKERSSRPQFRPVPRQKPPSSIQSKQKSEIPSLTSSSGDVSDDVAPDHHRRSSKIFAPADVVAPYSPKAIKENHRPLTSNAKAKPGRKSSVAKRSRLPRPSSKESISGGGGGGVQKRSRKPSSGANSAVDLVASVDKGERTQIGVIEKNMTVVIEDDGALADNNTNVGGAKDESEAGVEKESRGGSREKAKQDGTKDDNAKTRKLVQRDKEAERVDPAKVDLSATEEDEQSERSVTPVSHYDDDDDDDDDDGDVIIGDRREEQEVEPRKFGKKPPLIDTARSREQVNRVTIGANHEQTPQPNRTSTKKSKNYRASTKSAPSSPRQRKRLQQSSDDVVLDDERSVNPIVAWTTRDDDFYFIPGTPPNSPVGDYEEEELITEEPEVDVTELEVRVVDDQSERAIGFIDVRPTDTFHDVRCCIEGELDGLPERFVFLEEMFNVGSQNLAMETPREVSKPGVMLSSNHIDDSTFTTGKCIRNERKLVVDSRVIKDKIIRIILKVRMDEFQDLTEIAALNAF